MVKLSDNLNQRVRIIIGTQIQDSYALSHEKSFGVILRPDI